MTALTVPDSLLSGQSLSVSWQVTNESATATNQTAWTDRVYLSKLSSFNVDSCVLLGNYGRTASHLIFIPNAPPVTVYDPLLSGQSYTGQVSKTLANDFQGDYYVYVYTDVYDEVHEWGGASNDFNANNIRRSTNPVKVKLRTFPDLIVASVDVNKTAINADSAFMATVKFKNIGNAVAGRFTYNISLNDSANNAIHYYFPQYTTANELNVGDSITSILTLIAPNLSGKFRLEINADPSNIIYEYDKEDNNKTRSSILNMTPRSTLYCDLTVNSLTFTGTPASGGPLSISSILKNIGSSAAINISYSLLLSNDAVGSNPYYLSFLNSSGTLATNVSLADNRIITLPKGISGAKYLIGKVETNGENIDNNAANNTTAIPLSITLSPYPDLVITAISANAQAYASENVKVYYTLQNNGTGDLNGSFYMGHQSDL